MLNTVRQLLDVKGYQVWSISPDATVYAALEMMAGKNVGALVVCEGSQLVGMISERDYARKVILHGKTSKQTRVREIMSSPVYSVGPEQTIRECMQLMSSKHIRHLPVVDQGKVVGVISIGDVVNEIIRQQSETIRFLEDLTLDI
ncbi:MAG: CBS domain-containing protein [Anaerolineales bacterium]|jgi:CBS domain-containing protein